ALTFQNHTDCPLTDFGGKTSIFSHPVYLFLRKFSLQDSRGGSHHGILFASQIMFITQTFLLPKLAMS
ncbi:hypothetical protein, partial [Escherichia coli]|uniref:hypothetical protein n=1 Tax=Escherichia coli TaxID=562 RepID=UPI001F437429